MLTVLWNLFKIGGNLDLENNEIILGLRSFWNE
jgi:hypothetical protein